jgi:hypothetical protein
MGFALNISLEVDGFWQMLKLGVLQSALEACN